MTRRCWFVVVKKKNLEGIRFGGGSLTSFLAQQKMLLEIAKRSASCNRKEAKRAAEGVPCFVCVRKLDVVFSTVNLAHADRYQLRRRSRRMSIFRLTVLGF